MPIFFVAIIIIKVIYQFLKSFDNVLKTIYSRKAALRLRYKNEALVNMDHLPFDSFERRKKTTSLEEYVGYLRIYLRFEFNHQSEPQGGCLFLLTPSA